MPTRTAAHRTLGILTLALLCLASSCRDDPPAQETPMSIETLAAAPPPEDLEPTPLAVTLDSGDTAELSYTVLAPPTDPDSAPATADDTITVRFAAGLDRGPRGVDIYDSTEQRNQDFSFSLADPGVIRGLREAIPGMRPGELRRIEIPWRLAYGENGRGEIPPSTNLVFAIELISID
jgi:hypothetical protein